jgi:hypothetical protein
MSDRVGPGRAEPTVGVSVAPYALVRVSALTPPAEPPIAQRCRRLADDLAARERWCAEQAPAVAAVLHDRAGGADSGEPHRRVLLPLRRDLHNGRSPRPALRAALAQVPDPPEPLLRWLAVRDEADALADELAALAPDGLTAERAVLAELCRAEPLRRAVAYTSGPLLHAVSRTAECGGRPDDRSRKSEPNVLRYALRATTKSSPLSWFASVGWAVWSDVDSDVDGDPVAAAQPDRRVVDAVVSALSSRAGTRGHLALRLAPGTRQDGDLVRFRRPTRVVDPKAVAGEEEVTLPLSGPLRLVLDRLRRDGALARRGLTEAVAARAPGDPVAALATAERYVDSLLRVGLLVPCRPVDPQAPDAIGALTAWLATPAAADADRSELAAVLGDIDRRTRAFVRLPAERRPAELALLGRRWDEALAAAGAEPGVRRTPLTEDVTLDRTRLLGPDHGRAAVDDLARLAPLFEVFDRYAPVRRAARDLFVARYGIGGRCADLAGFGAEYAGLWQLADAGGAAPDLRSLREDLARLVADATGHGDHAVLPERVVSEAARRLPLWLRGRPASYAVFAQPLPGTAGEPPGLCVNAVHGGWGRYTSRFLDALGPDAAGAVAAQIRDAAGPDARLAQLRPVGGFNANLHPRLVADEVSDDPAWGTIRPDQLHLVHDPESDQLRLRHVPTGDDIDLLYLGFLIPLALPDRMMPLVTDLGSGLVDYARALAPATEWRTPVGVVARRPRLRYRGVVLARARWTLAAGTVRDWRSDLAAEPEPPVRAAARWRGLLGLPARVFARAPAAPADAADRPKPQYLDLGSALHVRNLSRLLARHPDGIVLEEALPEPAAGRPAVEIVAETYRRAW